MSTEIGRSMKYTIEYSISYNKTFGEEGLFRELTECLWSSIGVAWNEEAYKKLLEELSTATNWESVKQDMEEQFYVHYPRSEVGVAFPLKGTVEELARLWAYDIHQAAYDTDDIFDTDKTIETWAVREPGKNTRFIDMEDE